MREMKLMAMSAGMLAVLLGFTTVFQDSVPAAQQGDVYNATTQVSTAGLGLSQYVILILAAGVILVGLGGLRRFL